MDDIKVDLHITDQRQLLHRLQWSEDACVLRHNKSQPATAADRSRKKLFLEQFLVWKVINVSSRHRHAGMRMPLSGGKPLREGVPLLSKASVKLLCDLGRVIDLQ